MYYIKLQVNNDNYKVHEIFNMFKVHDDIEYNMTATCDCIDFKQIQGSHNHDNYHFVLKRLNVVV